MPWRKETHDKQNELRYCDPVCSFLLIAQSVQVWVREIRVAFEIQLDRDKEWAWDQVEQGNHHRLCVEEIHILPLRVVVIFGNVEDLGCVLLD